MTDREKTVLWLDGFMKNKEPMVLVPKTLIRLMHDALTKDAIAPIKMDGRCRCGNCRQELELGWDYCPICGNVVKW